MSLQEEIDSRRAEIRTDHYAMSIGEWINLYENDELDIHPEFQRFFRWTEFQKARFIESLLLGIPIPPIFVSQREDGVWDVVDGLQRLSTIFEFVGILRDEDGNLHAPLVLTGTKYLPALTAKRWDDEQDLENSLTTTQRLLVKRSKINVSIILRESEDMAKYELFQRLNTGGTPLSEQEVRNAMLVMANRDLYQWMRGLSKNENFCNVTALTDRALSEQFDLELILRFLVFRNLSEGDLANIGDMGQFLTEKMIEFAESTTFDPGIEQKIFEDTFKIIEEFIGPHAFHKYDTNKNRFLGGFLVSAYEGVALGIAYNLKNLTNDIPGDLLERTQSLWSQDRFTSNSGSGVRASSRIPHTIPVGREVFAT